MERLAIGQIGSPHGVKGFLKVKSHSGETDHFMRLREVTLVSGDREKVLQLEDIRIAGSMLLLKLVGIDSPEAAKSYAGWEIVVKREEAAALGEGEYYHADLCRCSIVKDSKPLGRIRSVCEGAASDLLEVETPAGRVFLIPFVNEFVGAVNLNERTVELKADWLLQ